MPVIKADQLQPGMVVSRDVRNIDGMLLVPSGSALTERQVGILQAWGVSEVDVETAEHTSDAGDPLARLSPETVVRMTDELKARYWRPDEFGPVHAEIFKLMLHRQARHLPAH